LGSTGPKVAMPTESYFLSLIQSCREKGGREGTLKEVSSETMSGAERAQREQQCHRKTERTPCRQGRGKEELVVVSSSKGGREGDRKAVCPRPTYLDLAKGLFGAGRVKADGLRDVVRLVLGNGHLSWGGCMGLEQRERRDEDDEEQWEGRDMHTTTCLPGGASAFDAQVGRHASDGASGCC